MRNVIYTCLTKGYDVLSDPVAVSQDFDYVCFTDSPEEMESQVWEFRPLPEEASPLLSSRRFKLLPHEAFPEYGHSVYLDANIRIMTAEFYDIVNECIRKGWLWTGVPHPFRDCVWDELEECCLKGRIPLKGALSVRKFLKDNDCPRHAGLLENNVIIRAHSDEAVRLLDEAWWDALLKAPYRDQLCLSPLFSKFHVEPHLLFGEGICARNTPHLQFSLHPGETEPKKGGTPFGPALLKMWRKAVANFISRA